MLLLTGEKGIGKFTLAFHIVNYFFSNNTANSYHLENLSINPDNNFYKSILNDINENFNYIGKNNSKNVSVDEIREIKRKFGSGSLNNLPRFTILDDADLLNSNSANALLKLIEEPSRLNYFILINNKRKKIIDTLKSRSLELKIFIDKKNKDEILRKLMINYNIETDTDINFINYTTPGNLLRIFDSLNEMEISNEDELYESSIILLDRFKKNKDNIYLETIKFLLDLQIEKVLNKKNYNFLKIANLHREIINRLFEFENYNLSKNIVLNPIKILPEYVG